MKKIAFLGKKGGVSKTSLSATTAVAFQKSGWEVLVADLDIRQGGITNLAARRKENNIHPYINSHVFKSVDEAIRKAESENYDLIIFDGAGEDSCPNHEIANQVDLIVLPTRSNQMDTRPQIELAHELTNKGIKNEKILFAISMVIVGEIEAQEAVDHLKEEEAGYKCANGFVKDRMSFRNALDIGKTLIEVPFKSLTQPVEMIIQSIADKIT